MTGSYLEMEKKEKIKLAKQLAIRVSILGTIGYLFTRYKTS